MGKNKILISCGGLRIGGLEKLLVEYANFISENNSYDVILFLMSDLGVENTLIDSVNDKIEVKYIKDRYMIKEKEELKKNKKTIFGKLKYIKFLNYEKKQSHKRYKSYIDNLDNVKVIIDFDLSLFKFRNEISKFKKIAFIHTSLKKYLKDENLDVEYYGKNLAYYDKIVVISQEMKEEIINLYPNLVDKLELIYNSLDFDSVMKKSLDKDDLSFDDKKLLKQDFFLSVARLDTRHKDFDTLIRAYDILKKEGRGEKLYILGTGDGEKEIRDLIRSLSLEEDVLLLGAKKNPYIWMKNAKLFIHSSKFEGFGLVLIEAGILGNIIIASDCPVGPKEILDSGQSGLLFETGNYVELVEKIRKVLNDDELKKNLKENMAVSVNRFRIENNLNKLYTIINNVCEEEQK